MQTWMAPAILVLSRTEKINHTTHSLWKIRCWKFFWPCESTTFLSNKSRFFVHFKSFFISSSLYQPTTCLLELRSVSVWVFWHCLMNLSWPGLMGSTLQPTGEPPRLLQKEILGLNDFGENRFLVESGVCILQGHLQVVALLPLFMQPVRYLQTASLFLLT